MALRRLNPFRYFADQRANIVKIGTLSLVSAWFQAATFILVVPLATAISKGDRRFKGHLGPFHINQTTDRLIVIALITVVVAAILDFWIAWMRSNIVTRYELRLREDIIREYLHSDYSTQAGERLGTLITLVSYANRGAAALGNITNGLEAILTMATFVAGAIFVDYRAALFLIGTVVALSIVLRPVMMRTKKYSKATAAMAVDYNREVTEVTRMVRDVRVFHAIDPLAHYLTDISRKLQRLKQRSAFASGVTSPVYQYTGVALLVGALAVAKNVHSLDLTVVGTIALLVLRSLSFGQQLQNSYQGYLDCIPYVEQLEERRRQYVERAVVDGTVTLEAAQRLDLVDVRFSYDGETEALAGVSGSFSIGEIVGVVGPSGGGKSTLSQLILRLREPTGGAILMNGVPAADYTLASWCRNVSLVPQDPRLLHGTVTENIAFLDASISREQVVDAAKAAGVHEVIEALEHGYDTLIGPAFRDLSGGQIQRIGIARALVRGARVLVLDEPTSALDVHSEVIIQNTLEALREHALVVIIAHRLSTLSICDRIVVLRQGQVETMGTLSDVSERSDFFKRALDAGTLEIAAPPPPSAGAAR
jgi:ATP-binding cassette, subfamily B, bacterial